MAGINVLQVIFKPYINHNQLSLPVRFEVLFELSCIEHLVRDHLFFLQGCDVLADAVIEDRVVAFGQQFINFGFEVFDLFELPEDEVFLYPL